MGVSHYCIKAHPLVSEVGVAYGSVLGCGLQRRIRDEDGREGW